MPVFADPEIIRKLRATAAAIEQGNVVPLRRVATTLREAVNEFRRLDEGVDSQPHRVIADRVLATAIHMLHEQAHGDTPFQTCQADPCRDLPLNLRGPAPRVLFPVPA